MGGCYRVAEMARDGEEQYDTRVYIHAEICAGEMMWGSIELEGERERERARAREAGVELGICACAARIARAGT